MQLTTACGKYCKVYKTCITDLELSTTPLTDGCHNDDVIQLVPLRSQSLFQFVQISDAYFLHLHLRYFSHSVISWIQIWRIWRPQLRWEKFSSFFLYHLNGSTRAVSNSIFGRYMAMNMVGILRRIQGGRWVRTNLPLRQKENFLKQLLYGGGWIWWREPSRVTWKGRLG